MAEAPLRSAVEPHPVLEALATGLFAVFVVLLFLAYLSLVPSIIYPGLASIPLVASLGLMFWVNWTADRGPRSRAVRNSS